MGSQLTFCSYGVFRAKNEWKRKNKERGSWPSVPRTQENTFIMLLLIDHDNLWSD